MNRLKEFALAIQNIEGYFPGSRAYRNRNPGNLRYSKFQSSVDGGYSVFPSYEEGFNALLHDLRMKCLGQTRTGLNPNSTLLDFAKVWAPSWDNNNPYNYAVKIALALKLSIHSQLKEIYTESPILQRILCLLVNEPGQNAVASLSLIQDWFENLEIGTYIETIIKPNEELTISEVRGFTGSDNTKLINVKVIDPELVKVLANPYLKNHHLILFIFKSGGQLTPAEFPLLHLGANTIQLPIMVASTPKYLQEFLIHEILHAWYARLAYNGIIKKDRVHECGLNDSRPEYNYTSIVKELFPYKELIFRELTREEKIRSVWQALVDLYNYVFKFLQRSG